MLIQTNDAICDVFRKSHLSRNVCAALTPRLYKIRGNLAPIFENVKEAAKTFSKTGLGPGVADHELQDLPQASIDQLEIILKADVIRQIKLANARSVAAAAEILQQKCVVEVMQLWLTEADLSSNARSDVTAANTMPVWLALGHIERLAEGFDNLGQTYLYLLHH
jgi:hypothetical protein